MSTTLFLQSPAYTSFSDAVAYILATGERKKDYPYSIEQISLQDYDTEYQEMFKGVVADVMTAAIYTVGDTAARSYGAIIQDYNGVDRTSRYTAIVDYYPHWIAEGTFRIPV